MKPRDGVWISNGLSADFRLLYEHPNATDVFKVSTAAGDHYAYGKELIWDCAPCCTGKDNVHLGPTKELQDQWNEALKHRTTGWIGQREVKVDAKHENKTNI